MTVIAIIAIVIAVVALLVAAAAIRRTGPLLVGKTVVIHTRKPDDQTIKGVLHGKYPDVWTLRDAVVVLPNREQALGGIQHVPVANIAYAQEIEA